MANILVCIVIELVLIKQCLNLLKEPYIGNEKTVDQ